ncbi:MAG TPA: type 4a pilus biogenesis protein PilO [Thermoanaerobaculia bacterium]|nr:type 4a pilus biogenesis protein PilO [Thermoanaerobaculia bacterium]
MAMQTGLEGKPWYYGAVTGVVLAVVLYLLGNVLFFKPVQKQIQAQEQRLGRLQTKIQEGRAAKLRLPQFREEVERLQLDLDKLLRILPARRNTPDLLRRIRSLTEQGDFDLLRFTPGNFAPKDFYYEWPIHIALNGAYHNLALFFDRIRRFSRIINIENLTISALHKAGSIYTIGATFTAKTFIYKEEEPEASTSKKGRGRRGRRGPK